LAQGGGKEEDPATVFFFREDSQKKKKKDRGGIFSSESVSIPGKGEKVNNAPKLYSSRLIGNPKRKRRGGEEGP